MSRAPHRPAELLPSLLLLLLNELDVRAGYTLEDRNILAFWPAEQLLDVIAHISLEECVRWGAGEDIQSGIGKSNLDYDLVEPLRVLRDGRSGRELLRKKLGRFLEVDVCAANSSALKDGDIGNSDAPNASRPWIEVTYLFLFRCIRLIVT